MPECRHCSKMYRDPPDRHRGNRNLCWQCYQTPHVRRLYPRADRRGPCAARGRRFGDVNIARPRTPEPTDALPGTPEKVAVLRERAARREALWSAADAGMGAFVRRLLAGPLHVA